MSHFRLTISVECAVIGVIGCRRVTSLFLSEAARIVVHLLVVVVVIFVVVVVVVILGLSAFLGVEF